MAGKMDIRTLSERLTAEVGKVMIGKEAEIGLILTAVFSGGHVLLDDLPGSGKTTLIKTLSRAMDLEFRRVQFTPDLLPSDILGMTVYNRREETFSLKKGPVFTDILLADEINRAIPRTQSALLEAMEEQQVTIEGRTEPLSEEFFVMATQNPVERESTFPLPAAQMDRFFMRLSLGYPTAEEEERMLLENGARIPFAAVEPVITRAELKEVFDTVDGIYVGDAVRKYIVSLVQATRSDPRIEAGASPRASKALLRGGMARAAMQGRGFVTPDDIQALAVPVLNHRLILKAQFRFGGSAAEDIVRDLLNSVPVPRAEKEVL